MTEGLAGCAPRGTMTVKAAGYGDSTKANEHKGPPRSGGPQDYLADESYGCSSITFLIRSKAQSISFRVMISGGAMRITWSWVSLQRMPNSFSASQ
jgi:hypothetical protein